MNGLFFLGHFGSQNAEERNVSRVFFLRISGTLLRFLLEELTGVLYLCIGTRNLVVVRLFLFLIRDGSRRREEYNVMRDELQAS